jgi:hypothetical protein
METRRLAALVVLVYATLLSSHPAHGQFSPQGPKLVGTDAEGKAKLGSSVCLSADGNTAIVGGPEDNGNAGAAWVWTRSGGVWTQQGTKLVGSGAVGSAFQGFSVGLSSDGNTAIVGGYGDNNFDGAAWVWTRNGGVWTQQGTKLVGSGVVGNANQGYSVALSGDGNTAIVGGVTDNDQAGAAWVWTRSGAVWTQQGAKLVGSGAKDSANQGWSVSLSASGNTAIVGGPFDNSNAGAAWVWTRSGGVWTQQGTKLVGSDAVGTSVYQGWSVSLSSDGNTTIVGGLFDNTDVGAAWVWTRSGGVWTQQGSKLVGSGAGGGFAEQGGSVSLSGDGNTALVGGADDNYDFVLETAIGAAWVWTRSGGVWTQQSTKLVGSGAVGNGAQGTAVSLSADGKTAIVGGDLDNNGAGAAWVFSTADQARPTITSFKATPSTITSGQSSTLSWTTTNTTSVAISGVAGTQSVNGSVSVFPTASTNYTLTATGSGGTATAITTVTVNAAPPQAPIPVLLGSATTPGTITTDGAKLYIGSGNNVLSMPIAGGTATTLYAAATPCCVLGITQAGGNLFWIDPNGDPDATAIFRGPTGGGSRTKIYSGFATGQPIVDGSGLTTDGSRLYAVDEVSGNLVRMNLDGSAIAKLGSRYGGSFSTEHLNRVTVSGGMLYIADEGCNCSGGTIVPKIVSMPAGGGGFATLFDAGPGFAIRPHDLTVVGSTIFFSDSVNNTIWKMPTSGGTPTSFIAGAPFSRVDGITSLGDALYVTDSAAGRVYKVAVSQAARNVVKRRAVAPPGTPSSTEIVTQTISAKNGGTMTLAKEGAIVTFLPGTFTSDQSVTIRSDPMSDEDRFLYGEAEGILDAGPSTERAITIDTGTQAPLEDIPIALSVSDTLLAQIGATRGLVVLVENYSFDDTESAEAFDPVDSSYDASAKRITTMIPAWTFTDQRASSGALQAAFTLGSLSLDGATAQPNGFSKTTVAQSAPNCYLLQTKGCFFPTGKYQSPLVGIPLTALTINSPYGERDCQGCSGNHDGVDVRCVNPAGDPVQPMVTGWIAKIGFSPSTGQMIGVGFIGTDGHEHLVLYEHLKPHSIQVPKLTDCTDYPCSSTPDPNQHWNGSRGACHTVPKVGRQCGYYQSFPRGAYLVTPAQTIGTTDHSGWTKDGVSVPCHLHLEVGDSKIPNNLPAHVGRIDPIACGVIPAVVLQLSTTGTGKGTIKLRVESQPAVTCPLPGTFNIGKGLHVMLTAEPDTSNGSVFGGWQGLGCGGAALTCTLTLTGDAMIAAMFNGSAACSTQQVAGNNTPETRIIEMGKSSGTFSFGYDTFTIPDEMIVTYEGKVLFDTGCVGQSGAVTLSYAGVSTKISVQVKPNCQGDTSTGWEFTVGCPK